MKKGLLSVVLLGLLFVSACTAQPAVQPASVEPPSEAGSPQPAAESASVKPAEEAAVPQTAEQSGFTVTDALGREVSFKSAPQRIVVAGKAVFMLADALYAFPEGADRLVAIADRSQSAGAFLPLIDPNFADKTVLDGDASAEQIAPLKPDLVVLKSFTREKLGKPIEELGIPVVYLDFETPEQYERDLKTVGAIMQNPGRADVLINEYQRLAKVTEEISSNVPAEKRPKVLLLYYNEKDGAVALNIPPATWIQTTLTKLAGGIPIWEDANTGTGWNTVNFEQIAAWDADQIYIITYSADLTKALAELKADPQWQALRAMKDGKVYGFPTDFYSYDQPDTRWYMGLSWLAAKINPDQYPDFNMEETIYKFYKTVYNVDEAAVKETVLPSMKGDWK